MDCIFSVVVFAQISREQTWSSEMFLPSASHLCSMAKLGGSFEVGQRGQVRIRVQRSLSCFWGGRPHLKCHEEDILSQPCLSAGRI